MAWLNVTPEKQTERRFEVHGWQLPDLHPDEYLHRIWSEDLGEARDGQPIEWQELRAYAEMTGQELDPEEWRILREMSVAYCGQLHNLNRFEDMSLSPLGKALDND